MMCCGWPKGFIPELSDAAALMWIEHRLREADLSKPLRDELEDGPH